MSGLILLTAGLLRLGTFIKYIPYPVTVGFTAGIAVIIFSGELADLFGLTLGGKQPGPFIPKLFALYQAALTINVEAVAVATLSIGAIVAVRRWRPQWPAYLIGCRRLIGPLCRSRRWWKCCRRRFRSRFSAALKAFCRRSSPTV
jgi:sulfate permease, SulP family